jgi:glutamate carboxypeptidase
VRSLLTYCEDHLEHTVAMIETLVRLESPSTDKPAVDRCGETLVRLMREAGADVDVVPQTDRGNHVRARVPGRGTPVLILGHFDTVWPIGTLERMPIRREGDRLFGPGTFDMKAGIAIALTALAAVRAVDAPHHEITMLWTTDEEIGSGTSRAIIEAEARQADAVFVLEPALGPDGALKTARKGCGQFEIIVDGIAAHAGVDPSKGASAIHELAAQIAAAESLQDLPNGVSVNVGLVSGGTRPNVVAEQARAVVDVRAPTLAQAAAVEYAIRSLQPRRRGTRLTIRGGFERPPMERTPSAAQLFERARGIAAAFGRELHEGSTGGGSDGNFTAALGVRTLDGLGAVGDGAHAAHEHIDVAALAWRCALTAGLLAAE